MNSNLSKIKPADEKTMPSLLRATVTLMQLYDGNLKSHFINPVGKISVITVVTGRPVYFFFHLEISSGEIACFHDYFNLSYFSIQCVQRSEFAPALTMDEEAEPVAQGIRKVTNELQVI